MNLRWKQRPISLKNGSCSNNSDRIEDLTPPILEICNSQELTLTDAHQYVQAEVTAFKVRKPGQHPYCRNFRVYCKFLDDKKVQPIVVAFKRGMTRSQVMGDEEYRLDCRMPWEAADDHGHGPLHGRFTEQEIGYWFNLIGCKKAEPFEVQIQSQEGKDEGMLALRWFQNSVDFSETFRCDECGDMFANNVALHYHQFEVHRNLEPTLREYLNSNLAAQNNNNNLNQFSQFWDSFNDIEMQDTHDLNLNQQILENNQNQQDLNFSGQLDENQFQNSSQYVFQSKKMMVYPGNQIEKKQLVSNGPKKRIGSLNFLSSKTENPESENIVNNQNYQSKNLFDDLNDDEKQDFFWGGISSQPPQQQALNQENQQQNLQQKQINKSGKKVPIEKLYPSAGEKNEDLISNISGKPNKSRSKTAVKKPPKAKNFGQNKKNKQFVGKQLDELQIIECNGKIEEVPEKVCWFCQEGEHINSIGNLGELMESKKYVKGKSKSAFPRKMLFHYFCAMYSAGGNPRLSKSEEPLVFDEEKLVKRWVDSKPNICSQCQQGYASVACFLGNSCRERHHYTCLRRFSKIMDNPRNFCANKYVSCCTNEEHENLFSQNYQIEQVFSGLWFEKVYKPFQGTDEQKVEAFENGRHLFEKIPPGGKWE